MMQSLNQQQPAGAARRLPGVLRGLMWLAGRIDGLNQWVGTVVSWFTSVMVVVVFTDVLMRYIINTSFVFMQELEWHLFGFIFLMGAGYTLLHDGHVRVDIIYQRISSKARAWVNVMGCLVFLFPGCYLVVHFSFDYAWQSLIALEGSPNPGGIPMRFILKSCIPLGFTLLALQGFSMFAKSLKTIYLGLDEEA